MTLQPGEDVVVGRRLREVLSEARKAVAGLAHVPFRWPCVDGYYWLRPDPVPTDEVCRRWLAALAHAAETSGFFLTICHAFVTGVDDARLAVLDAVVAAAVADPRVTIRTAGEVARAVLEGDTA